MKSCNAKGAYDAPRVNPSSLLLEAALLATSSTVLFVNVDDLHNLNYESEDEYFEVVF